MSKFDDQYIDLCRRILESGEKVTNYKKEDHRSKKAANAIPDHTAQGASEARTIRLPHQVLQFNLEEEFPILTSKKVAFKTAVIEILWIYQQASNDVRWLQERGVKIWNEWEISEKGVYQGRNINKIFAKEYPSEPKEDFAHTIGTAYGWIVKKYDLVGNFFKVAGDMRGKQNGMILLRHEFSENLNYFISDYRVQTACRLIHYK